MPGRSEGDVKNGDKSYMTLIFHFMSEEGVYVLGKSEVNMWVESVCFVIFLNTYFCGYM